MTNRARPLPPLLLGLCLALTAGAYLLLALTWRTPGYQRTGQETFSFAVWPLLFLAYPLVGAAIARRHPGNRVGWLFCAIGLLVAAEFFAGGWAAYGLKARPGALPAAATVNWFQSWAFFPMLGLILVFTPLLFPDGRLPGPRWWVVAWAGAVGIAAATAAFTFSPGPLDDAIGGFPNPYPLLPDPAAAALAVVGFPLTLASVAAAGTAMVRRMRRARGAEREQLKWIAYAAVVVAVAFACHLALSVSGLADRVPWYWVLWGAALCGVPVAAGLAILRRGLFDIDLLINRTLVYAALTALVAGGYVALVAGSNALLGQGGFARTLAATAAVAIAFHPLHERVQRGVNRLLYGERDDPYAVVSRLGRQLEGTLAPQDVLPAIVGTLTEALRLPYAAILLTDAARPATAVAAGTPVGDLLRLPLVYQGESVGELHVAPRRPGEAFSTADRRLLADLARQVGVAAHAVRLANDLQRSRERIVAAREEERRRLRRDLHDGLGAQLAAMAMQAGALRATIARDPALAEARAAELRQELREAVGDVRRLVHGLRPPALDELGLTAAIRQRAIQFGAEGAAPGEPGLAISVDAPDPAPPLPAAVEVAVYRVAEEALANATRHAAARRCRVRLAVDDRVTLTVEDDGIGIEPGHPPGVGLFSMRERAEELGGRLAVGPGPDGRGTRVALELPLAPLDEGRADA